MKKKLFFFLVFLPVVTAVLFTAGCTPGDAPYDSNVEVPKGDPSFTPLSDSWVIDKAGVLSEQTKVWGNVVLETLKEEKIAEVVVLVQTGIKNPEDYATHYGRWLKLGKKGFSTKGGNNGLVWLIRPDADEKITVSVGRGLPEFTATDFGRIMEQAKDYLNFNNFDKGVKIVIDGTDKSLRKIYGKKEEK